MYVCMYVCTHLYVHLYIAKDTQLQSHTKPCRFLSAALLGVPDESRSWRQEGTAETPQLPQSRKPGTEVLRVRVLGVSSFRFWVAAQTEVYSRTRSAFPSPTFIFVLSKNTWKLAFKP